MDAAWKIFALIGFVIVGTGVYIAYSTSEKVKAVASWPTVTRIRCGKRDHVGR